MRQRSLFDTKDEGEEQLLAPWAIVSPDGLYRYTLFRGWGAIGREALFILLNPSTADGTVDDPTVCKCRLLTRGLGLNAMRIGNLYAFRATDPKALARAADPIGPECNDHLRRMIGIADIIICGWGNPPAGIEKDAFATRAAEVLDMVRGAGKTAMAYRVNATGHPHHPLYLPGDAKPVAYARPLPWRHYPFQRQIW
jgi:hypothetical protein